MAGLFYPAGRDQLAAQVEHLLSDARRTSRGGAVRAIIAPHAGYVHSGPVAASAFAALRDLPQALRPQRVVVIGPAHHVAFAGIAAPNTAVFATPLGEMPVDREAIERIRALPQVLVSDEPHKPEHALEVELPFILTVLGPLPIVPLLVGQTSGQEVAEVLRQMWDDATLVVVSSDLSHYLDAKAARDRDAATAAAIEHLDNRRIGHHDACGALALRGLLIEAARRGLVVERVDLRNSGDTSGDCHCVVGYGAWILRDPEPGNH